MVFTIRVRTSSGVKRLLFPSPSSTVGDLRAQLHDLCGVPPDAQRLTLASPPGTALDAPPTTTLEAAGLRHGDMYNLAAPAPASGDAPAASAAPAARPASRLTARCRHGPRGRCVYCLAEDPHAEASAGAPEVTPATCPAGHGPGARCPRCSLAPADDAPPAEWLCNHPDTAFCPKCLPPPAAGGDAAQGGECTCDKARGQRCLHCMARAPKLSANFVPYRWMMHERRAMCRFSHGPAETCASCADPPVPSYVGKADCNRGHRPWPYGVCLNCAPPNAHLRLQKYRHCDSVAMHDVAGLQRFYGAWTQAGDGMPRAAILMGRHIEAPLAEGGGGGGGKAGSHHGEVTGEVYAVYRPPQESTMRGVRFLRDAHERNVHKVSALLGLAPVGWVVATLPREGAKYGGRVFLSGSEVRQAARFQRRYADERGHSRFVTVVMEHGEAVEPVGYQVSDECVALERDGVLASAPDAMMLVARKPKAGEIVPSVVYKNRPLDPGHEFLPDELLVKVGVGNPRVSRPIFRHADYEPPEGNGAVKGAMRAYLARHAAEPLHTRLSDFGFLCHLASEIGLPLTERVVRGVASGSPFEEPLRSEVERKLRGAGLL